MITLEFKATSGDGILFYVADSEENPTQYFSLEIIGGKLRFQFKSGAHIVQVNTISAKTDGKWHRVSHLETNVEFLATVYAISKIKNVT